MVKRQWISLGIPYPTGSKKGRRSNFVKQKWDQTVPVEALKGIDAAISHFVKIDFGGAIDYLVDTCRMGFIPLNDRGTPRQTFEFMMEGEDMSEDLNEMHLAKILLDIPLFEDLDFSQVATLINTCKRRELQPKEVLCKPRTIDERLLIFLKGKLRLESAEGTKVAEMTPVRVIGEMGVFTGQTRSSRVVVEEPSTFLELDSVDLQELVEGDPQMGNHMLVNLVKLLYSRMYDTNEELGLMRGRAERLQGRLEEVAPDDPLLAELFPEGPA